MYKGFRLFAADGSDIQIPYNPNHASSHYPGANGQSPYNLLHLDAIYDLLQCTYQDACLSVDRFMAALLPGVFSVSIIPEKSLYTRKNCLLRGRNSR